MGADGRDTIVAVATPPGRGGLSVLRISGPQAFAVALSRITRRSLPAHGCSRLVWLKDHDGQRLDQALLLVFHAPHSYTGEDVVEVHTHGAPFVVESVLKDLLRDCAAADPGEFTRRAVENGRMRLDQAEGVQALAEASSGLGHQLALRALAGGTGSVVEALRLQLLDVLSQLEADLDFSDHDIEAATAEALMPALAAMRERVAAWMASWHTGRLATGAQVVLVGAPNAGKSTLLNALAGQERALVDEGPGTTRDAIGVELRLDEALTITLWDTAGLHEGAHGVEKRGMALTRQRVAQADIILHLVAPEQCPLPEVAGDPRCLLVFTKADLGAHALADQGVQLSAKSGLGLDELRTSLRKRLLDDHWQQLELVVSEARHLDLLRRADTALARAELALTASHDFTLAAADLRDAAQALGAITGAVDFDEIYPRIFARFCIGK